MQQITPEFYYMYFKYYNIYKGTCVIGVTHLSHFHLPRRSRKQKNEATKTGNLKKQSAGLVRSELPLEQNEEMKKNTEMSESSRSSNLL